MMTPPRAARVYRRLLVLLPRGFREEAESDLLEVFRDAYARVAAGRRRDRAVFWLRALLDLAVTAAAERRMCLSFPTGADMRLMLDLLADMRTAIRRLWSAPVWTLSAAATLAIGLAAAIVSAVLIRDIVLQPLSLPDADRLVRLREIGEDGRCCWYPSFPNAADWREQARMFSGVGIADIPRVVPVLLDGTAVRVPVSRAARGLFETLRVQPAAGRFFSADENRPGGAPVAVVSERFWRGQLSAREPGTAAITIGTTRYMVVGVLPASFRFLGEAAAWGQPADVWTAMDRDTNLGGRTSHGYHVVARLRDGITLERARREMNALAHALETRHHEPTQAHTVQMQPLPDLVVGKAREPLRLLSYAAAGLLLIACLNLAAAILAMGISRTRELSIRLALGASRWRTARLLLVEANVLAVPGSVFGLLLAGIAFAVLRAQGSSALPRLDEVHLDPAAGMFGLALGVVTATVAAAAPALLLPHRGLVGRLRTHGATTGPREHRRLWTTFLVVQAALTVLLLTGTGLLLASFSRAVHVDLGYRSDHVLAVDIGLPASYEAPARKVAFYDAALTALRMAPQVTAAGLTSVLPDSTTAYTASTSREGGDGRSLFSGYRLVDGGYFDAIGIPRLRGDAQAFGSGMAFVDQRLRNTLWSGADPSGDRVQHGFSDRVLTVGGVVGTVREWFQTDETVPAIYVDYHQRPAALDSMHFVVRYTGATEAAARTVHAALAGIDPLVPATIEPLDTRVRAALGDRRLLLVMAAWFGVLALLLSAAGVHAMVAFVAARQRRDAAIRMALGAGAADVLRRSVAIGLAPVTVGVLAGAALALPLGRLMRAQLFHVAPSDPRAVGGAAVAVALTAVLAAWLPARRAARVDPATALRQD
jgi:putative ABC transport system permease protein